MLFDSIDDPLKKNATIGFINNFGQIPKQLFKKAHPAKKMGGSRHSALIDPTSLIQGNSTVLQTDRLFFHNLDNLKPSLQPIKELKGPVGQILQPDKTVFAVEQNKVMMPPSYTKYIAWGFADHSLRIGLYDTDRASFVSEASAQNSREILTCACPNAKMIVTAGTSSVVTIWKFDANRKSLAVKHSLHGHRRCDLSSRKCCLQCHRVWIAGWHSNRLGHDTVHFRSSVAGSCWCGGGRFH